MSPYLYLYFTCCCILCTFPFHIETARSFSLLPDGLEDGCLVMRRGSFSREKIVSLHHHCRHYHRITENYYYCRSPNCDVHSAQYIASYQRMKWFTERNIFFRLCKQHGYIYIGGGMHALFSPVSLLVKRGKEHELMLFYSFPCCVFSFAYSS